MAKPNEQSQHMPNHAEDFRIHLETKDWSQTSVGEFDQWPDGLKTAFSIIKNDPSPKVICWGKGLVCIYNKAYFSQMLQHELKDILAQPLSDALPSLWTKLQSSIQDILQGKIEHWSTEIQHNISSENYQTLWQYMCQPVYTSQGAGDSILLHIRPEERSLSAKPAAVGNYNNFHQFLKLAPVGLLMLSGSDFKISLVNATFLKLTGNEESNLLHKPFFEIYPLVKEKFLPIVSNVLKSGRSFYADEIQIPISFEKKQRNFYLNIVLHPVPSGDGMTHSIMAVIVDVTKITERKHLLSEQEKKFRQLVKESRICILVLRGKEFIIEYGNDILLQSVFKMQREDVIGKPILSLFPHLNEQKYASQLRAVMKTGITIHDKESETIINTPNGKKRFFFDYEFAPLLDDDGTISGIMVNFYDVTENVRTRNKQLVNQRQLELSLEAGGLAIWEMSLPSEKITYTSRLAQILGAESLENKTNILRDLIHPDDKEKISHAFKSAMEKGKYFFEGRIQKADNSIGWIRIRGKVFYDANHNPVKLFGSTRDITQEKKKQLEIYRKESRLRHLILQAPMAIGILRGPDYKVEILNEAAQKLLGKTEAQLSGKPVLEVMTEVDIPLAKKMLDDVYYKGEVFSATEYPVKFMRNGRLEKIYVHFEYDPLKNSQGKTIGIIVVGMEVTDQVVARKKIEESESRFRHLANTGPYFVWSTNESGNIVFANETMQRFTGLSYRQLTKAGFFSLLYPDDVSKAMEKWNKAIQTGTEFIDEHRVRRADNTFHWHLTRATSQRDAAGKINGWIATCTDIGEIKEQEHHKDFFISRASHELKTPITSLKGYIQILQNINNGSEDSMLVNSLGRMNLMVDKLTRLIDDLLDSTRITNNQLLITKAPINLCSLIHDIIDEIKPVSDYEIIFDDSKCNVNILGDNEKLGQVFMNLLTNAIKYSPGIPKVWIETEQQDGYIKVAIIDQGIGISKAAHEKIFEKFYRVSGNNEETFPGFGIGLFIANEILKLHDSRLHVSSERGSGSTFYFYIRIMGNE